MSRAIRYQIHTIGRKIKRSAFLNKYFPKFKDPVYWRGDRASFARAGFIGSVCMMFPIPFQMVLGSVIAYYLRANIPVATAMAWISNPLTMPILYYGGYQFGTWLLDVPEISAELKAIEIGSSLWFDKVFPLIYEPFFIGNLAIGLMLGASLYMGIRVIKVPAAK